VVFKQKLEEQPFADNGKGLFLLCNDRAINGLHLSFALRPDCHRKEEVI
jgi:hypothetical protein